MPPEKIAELRVKHLEMVQAVISRLAGSGATIKNYCLTLSTAIAGVAVTLQRPVAGLLALLPVVVFAILDAQYLRNERRFRAHFEVVRSQDWGIQPSFDMTPARSKGFWSALFSWSVIAFYGTLAAAIVGVTLVSRMIHGRLV